jgi:phage FluMu protein Com
MPKRDMALIDMKCTACGKLLAKIELTEGTIERKCKCGTTNTLTTRKPTPKEEDQNATGSNAYQDRIKGMSQK